MTGIVESVASFFVGTAPVQGALQSGAALSTTAAGAATSGLIGAGGTITVSGLTSLLSTGLTLATVAQSLNAGNQQAGSIAMDVLPKARSLELASEEDMMAARDEEIAAQRAANDILENTRRAIASQQLASSASGLDVSYGTPVSTAKNTQKIGNIQASTTRSDAQVRALARRRQATERLIERNSLLQSGVAASDAARGRGVSNAINAVSDQVFRGVNRG